MREFEGLQFGYKRQRTSQEQPNLYFQNIQSFQINQPQVQQQIMTNDQQRVVHQPTSPQIQQLNLSSSNLAEVRNFYDQLKIQNRKERKRWTQKQLNLQKQQLLETQQILQQLHVTQKDALDQHFLEVENKINENFLKDLELAKDLNHRHFEQIEHASDYPIVDVDDLEELHEDYDMVDSRDGRHLYGSGQGADQQMQGKDVGNRQQLNDVVHGVGSQLASKFQGDREIDDRVPEAGLNQHVRTQKKVSLLIGVGDLNNTMNQEIKSSVVKDLIRQSKSKTQKQANKFQ